MSSLIGLDQGLTTEGPLYDLGSSSSKDMRENMWAARLVECMRPDRSWG